jgi:polyisoprenoid-binding protein YceI
MRKIFLSATALLFSVVSFAGTTWSVDNSHTNVKFSVTHLVVSEVEGNFKTFGGKVVAPSDDFQNADIQFSVDVASVNTDDEKRDGHLKSDDFFGVTAHPTSKFVITKVVSRGTPGAYKIVGNLNLKAATKELRFNADIKTVEGKQTAVAKITLDRSEYDIRFGSGSFFDGLGDKTIYDEFDLQVNLVASK